MGLPGRVLVGLGRWIMAGVRARRGDGDGQPSKTTTCIRRRRRRLRLDPTFHCCRGPEAVGWHWAHMGVSGGGEWWGWGGAYQVVPSSSHALTLCSYCSLSSAVSLR
jgi:hypothetical protein